MGLQLIFCMETTAKNKSDQMYIWSTIDHFYQVDQAKVKLSPVFMEGKGNYASKRVEKRITDLKKQYAAASVNNKSVIIYCFDCDDYDHNAEDAGFLIKAEEYCDKNQYRFVWFCKDIEDVFLGERIANNQKKKRAESFFAQKSIGNVSLKQLKEKRYKPHRSNLGVVLDEYLPGKL